MRNQTPDILGRRSIRLNGFDYSSPGAYYVTMCTQNRECLFGHFVGADPRVRPDNTGNVRPEITGCVRPESRLVRPKNNRTCPPETGGQTHGFAPTVTLKIVLNDAGKMIEDVWRKIPVYYPGTDLDIFVVMPNHVHGVIVIRENELFQIKRYIETNPENWSVDDNNPGT